MWTRISRSASSGSRATIASTIATCSSTDASTRPGMLSVSLPILVRCARRLSIKAPIRSFFTCA